MEENQPLQNNPVVKKYAGNPWLSSNTLLLIITLSVFLFVFWVRFHKDPVPVSTALIFITLMFYMKTHIQMNYFVIKGSVFIIKNHYSLGECTSIPLNEIEKFEIQKPSKLSQSLKITTIDGLSQVFIAGSLTKKDWDAFKVDMTKAGFAVTDNGNPFF